jgi:hypothetical protein
LGVADDEFRHPDCSRRKIATDQLEPALET